MEIALFKEITTEEALVKLEADGEKYAGLYVDMDKPKERKYVKDSALLINGLLKKVERARIDKARDYKVSVEAEAKSITERLESANKPFSLLIDAHKEKRAAELAAEKAAEAAQALLIKIEADHGEAIMIDKIRTIEAAEAEQARLDNERRIQEAAAEQARIQAENTAQAAIDQAEQEKQYAIQREEQAKLDAENADRKRVDAEKRAEDARLTAIEQARQEAAQAVIRAQQQAERAVKAEQDRIAEESRIKAEDQAKRERNKQHKGSINRQAVSDLVKLSGLTESQAKNVVTAIAKRQISAVSISY